MPEEEALIKRIMPNSLEAEQSLIGSMIMDRDAILTAMTRFPPRQMRSITRRSSGTNPCCGA